MAMIDARPGRVRPAPDNFLTDAQIAAVKDGRRDFLRKAFLTASAAMAPFLVAPNDSTSTPARHVASAGEQPSEATALAKRAPSMCTAKPRAWARLQSAANSSGR